MIFSFGFVVFFPNHQFYISRIRLLFFCLITENCKIVPLFHKTYCYSPQRWRLSEISEWSYSQIIVYIDIKFESRHNNLDLTINLMDLAQKWCDTKHTLWNTHNLYFRFLQIFDPFHWLCLCKKREKCFCSYVFS